MKNIIAFDAEFATLEILELSIYSDTLPFSGAPREIFHSLFRPETERRWPGSERVHHISPAMVRREPFFRRHRRHIQELIDRAECLVGFAIENDLEALRREGIEIPDDKPVVDVRDLHWIIEGKARGVELDARKGLAVTAAELGVDFNEDDAHGAGYDTLKTVECFRILISRFATEVLGLPEGEWPEDLIRRYQERWDLMREEYLESFAHGWVSLVETRDGYRIKASRTAPADEKGCVATVEVAARWRALNEIDARFDRRRNREHPTLYMLKPSDIDWFRSYANRYDGQENVHHRLHSLRRQTLRR